MPSESILGPKLGIILKHIERCKPDNYIEIGCYRCHTIRTVSEQFPDIALYGLDLFDEAPSEELAPLDGAPMCLSEAEACVPRAVFLKGDSKRTVNALPKLSGGIFVFIDGGHSAETTKADLMNIIKKYPKAEIVMDDATMPEVRQGLNETGLAYEPIGYSLVRIKNGES